MSKIIKISLLGNSVSGVQLIDITRHLTKTSSSLTISVCLWLMEISMEKACSTANYEQDLLLKYKNVTWCKYNVKYKNGLAFSTVWNIKTMSLDTYCLILSLTRISEMFPCLPLKTNWKYACHTCLKYFFSRNDWNFCFILSNFLWYKQLLWNSLFYQENTREVTMWYRFWLICIRAPA